MKIKILALFLTAASPISVLAQAETSASGAQPSALWSLFWSILPIVVVACFFIIFIRRLQKPLLKRSQDHMARQVEHMERVEQLLERIANAVEKKD